MGEEFGGSFEQVTVVTDTSLSKKQKFSKSLKFSLVVLAFGLTIAGGYFVSQKNLKFGVPGKASGTVGVHPKTINSPTLNDFEVPYKNITDIYTNPSVINSFGGGLLLQEFYSILPSANWPFYMAGHLGPFFAPPYYSDEPVLLNVPAADGTSPPLWTEDPNKGFHTGLALFDQNTKSFTYENSADHTKTKTLWSPAKMVVENSYPNFAGGITVKGVKAALPDVRGFTLKVDVKNDSASVKNLKILLLAAIPKMGIKNQWVWDNKPLVSGEYNLNYSDFQASGVNGDYSIITSKNVADPGKNIYLLLGVKGPSFTWQVTDFSNRSLAIDNFRLSGVLPNVNLDTSGNSNGSALSFAFTLPQLLTNESSGFTLYGFVGGSEKEVTDLWVNFSSVSDVEQFVEDKANVKVSQLFTNRLPVFSSGDANLNKVYAFSAIQTILNKWTTLSWYAGVNYRARSLGMFAWTTGTEMIFSQSDPAFWKNMIYGQMKMDLTSCNAISPYNTSYCNSSYAHTPFSLVRQLYEYVSLTSDKAFLGSAAPRFSGQTILDQLAMYVNQIDAKTVDPTIVVGSFSVPSEIKIIEGSKQIADFGGDEKLYEHSFRGCKIDNSITNSPYTPYIGMVPVPNAERFMAHQMLAKLYGFYGDTGKSNLHKTLAENFKTVFNQSFWDSDSSWLGIVTNKTAPTTNRKIMYFVPVLNAIGYEGLLSREQIEKMVNTNLGKFVGTYGLFSTEGGNNGGKSTSICTRPDWQGPGLYTGQIGMVLTHLLQNNFTGEAYEILNKYTNYLGQVPVIAWMYDGTKVLNQTRYDSYQEFETPALAEMVVRGMMGLDPSTGGTSDENVTWIKPKVPEALLAKGPVKFEGALSQGHLWSLTATPTGYEIFMTPSYTALPVVRTRLAVDVNKKTTVRINHLATTTNMQVRLNGNIIPFVTGSDPDTIVFNLDPNKGVVYIEPKTVAVPTPVVIAPETYPVGKCTSWPNNFSNKSLNVWWGTSGTAPTSSTKIDAYTNRTWNGNVQELVFSGGDVYYRTGVGKLISSVEGKTWYKKSLAENLSGLINIPPTTGGIKGAAYYVLNGKFTEQIFGMSTDYVRQTNTNGQYDFATTWTSSPVSSWPMPAGCNVYPNSVTTYARRVLNNESWELVGNGSDLYYRKAVGADASVLNNVCFTKTTFAKAWPVTGVLTASPTSLGYQLLEGEKIREMFIDKGYYYYRDCN